jgi:uncharacterized protein
VIGVRVRFRFHGELNDFLSPIKRNIEFEHTAGATDTIKHVIESLGVPHTEVEHVTANGLARSSSERLAQGDVFDVFPHAPPMHIDQPRFVLDGHLGRLAAYLRMLGFDTWYDRFAGDPLLAAVAGGERRFLLTRDVGLLKRREVAQGYCVRSHKPHDQLREVASRFDLRSQFIPFSRCMECNGSLYPVPKSEIADLLPPHTRETKTEFSRCLKCGKIYWRGSHYARMLERINQLTVLDNCL